MKIPRSCCLLLAALAGSLPAEYAAAQQDLTARGERLAKERCARCHGHDGRGRSAEYASLAGQHPEYFVKQIFNFKTGQRTNPVMIPVIEPLMAVDVRALSQYYASLQPGNVPADEPALLDEGRTLYFRGNAASGVGACVTCHGADAKGGAQMPRMAGQNTVYLENQLRGFIQRTRHNDRMMHLSLANMTEREISAVAAYLGAAE